MKAQRSDCVPVKADKTRELTQIFLQQESSIFPIVTSTDKIPDEKIIFILALHRKLEFLHVGRKSQAENLTIYKLFKGFFCLF